jgi:hypothetical protein
VVRAQRVDLSTDLSTDLPDTILNQVCGQPGDSAPVTVNNRLAGMIHGALHRGPAHLHRQVHTVEHPGAMSMNAVIGDVTNRNRPGSCFVPIVA